MAKVSLENVWKIYNEGQRAAVNAVRDASFEIQDGEFVALLGPSGCGKTSILRMIAGLEAISRGAIRIGDRVVNGLKPSERNIAMAFETYALYPHLPVRENLTFCLRARNLPKAEIDARLKQITQALGIEALLDKIPSELPGGQQQLVSVARAMIRDPNVFLLDEPFSHIDASVRVQVRAEIKRLVNRAGTTTILVTHDQHEAVAMADRIVVMNFAEVQQVGTAHDLFHRPSNAFVASFVGEPAINIMGCALEASNGQNHLRLTDAQGLIPVSASAADTIRQANAADLAVGIRPQELSIAPHEGFIAGEVSFFEFLGEENHMTIASGRSTLVLVTDPAFSAGTGERVRLSARLQEVIVFDRTSGKALCHGVQ